jgi:type IV pilus biogenesis protein CpaD/CtpE
MDRNPLRLAAALAATTLLAACGFQPVGSFERPEYRVQAAQGQYNVSFLPTTAELAPGEQERLGAFVRGLALRDLDEVLLTVGESGSPELNRARAAAVATTVEASGPARALVVDSRRIAQAPPSANVVFVQPLRRGQLLVACPSAYLDANEAQYASRLPPMNCSNEANLAYMASRPADLIVPRTLGPSEGTTSAAAVARHREDRIKLPDPVNTSAGN